MKHLNDEQIDKITHRNAMSLFQYDPFSVIPRAECTVGALRAKADHVDVTPLSFGAREAGTPGKPVTSGDIAAQFAQLLEATSGNH